MSTNFILISAQVTKEQKKEIKPVFCRGSLPDKSLCCEEIYESDGEFLYIRTKNDSLLIVNEDLDFQRIKCPNCGYKMIWKRADAYLETRINQKGRFTKGRKISY